MTGHDLVKNLSFVSHLHIAHVAGTFTDIGGPAQIHLLNRQSRNEQLTVISVVVFVETTDPVATVKGLCPLPQELTSRPQDRAIGLDDAGSVSSIIALYRARGPPIPNGTPG